MIKLSVNETKWSSLPARTRALILYISNWIFNFGPEKLPGLSRNGPQLVMLFATRRGCRPYCPWFGLSSFLDCSPIAVFCELQKLMHQSIPPAPSPPPPLPGWPPSISIFFFLDGKFTGVGALELLNPPGWGRKKRANAPSSVNTATFFIDRTVKWCRFKHFDVRIFGLIKVN